MVLGRMVEVESMALATTDVGRVTGAAGWQPGPAADTGFCSARWIRYRQNTDAETTPSRAHVCREPRRPARV